MTSLSRKKKATFLNRAIDKILLLKTIQRKYLIVYLLEYIKDYGLFAFLKEFFKTLRTSGFKVIFQPRKVLLHKINTKGSGAPASFSPQPTVETSKKQIEEDIPKLTYQPKISFVMPVYNTEPALLKIAIESIKSQIYHNWELCIADDYSSNPSIRKLLDNYTNDPRIKVIHLAANVGISEATNEAISLSSGSYTALMDHDDEITEDALYWIIKELNKNTNPDIIYSDECKVDEKGNLSDYFFKPAWSPELLLNMMYIGHLTVYKKDFLLKEAGLFRKEYDFSQDYDLALRAVEKTKRISHIPKVLYHWRITKGSAAMGEKPYARRSNLAALENAMQRRNIAGEVSALSTANRIKLKVDNNAGVSIIIPTDSLQNLTTTLLQIHSVTNYPHFEIIVVTNSNLASIVTKKINYSNLHFVRYDEPYNFSDKCNKGAAKAHNNILIFLNDDVRPLQADWIENTIEYLFMPGVGGVSPKLIYEDDSIQYAGMITGVRSLVGTAFHKYHKDSTAYINFIHSVRNVSILSGACLAIRKDIFEEIDGFDAVNTPSAHSDVDLSFKLLEKGLRNIYTPYATLRHIGHLSLEKHEKNNISKKDKADIFLLKKWAKYISEDPYFSEAMKNYLYHDSPEPYRLYGSEDKSTQQYKNDILVVTHDLTLSGAPINLYEYCKILKANGYFVVVCSPSDGPLKDFYVKENIPLVIDSLLLAQHDTVKKFAKNFDCIICNTIVTWPFVNQMQNIDNFVPIIWWLQEGSIIDHFAQHTECAKTLKKAKTIIGLSEYSLSFIKKYNPGAIKIYNTCPDIYDAVEAETKLPVKKNEKTIISLIGSIEKRKGQDILLNALDLIDNNLLESLEVRFIGKYHDKDFAEKLKRSTSGKSHIRFLGEVTNEACHKLINETDLLVNASRDEPLSVALVEGFCLGKPCIVSENTGIAELITDGVNGFIFKHEDPNELAKLIVRLLSNKDSFKKAGSEARLTYEKYLSVPTFQNKMLNLLDAQIISIKANPPQYSDEHYTSLIKPIENEAQSITILMHIYYPGSWSLIMKKCAAAIEMASQIIITVCHDDIIPETEISEKITILKVPNKGKDIGGKLVAMSYYLHFCEKTKCVIFLHDKISPQTINAEFWLENLYSIFKPELLLNAINELEGKTQTGIIGAKTFLKNEYIKSEKKFATTNNEVLTKLITQYNLSCKTYDFIAGTIFIAKSKIFEHFFSTHSALEAREQLETGNVLDLDNGTYTHSWERLFCFIAEDLGYNIKGI
ncbi:MAG: glycosyltransferase [Chitinophagaceae bacterium]